MICMRSAGFRSLTLLVAFLISFGAVGASAAASFPGGTQFDPGNTAPWGIFDPEAGTMGEDGSLSREGYQGGASDYSYSGFDGLEPGSYVVTLITGHQVHVRVNTDGTVAATVNAGAGGESPAVFRTVETDDGFYVFPAEVSHLVPSVLDKELFNITYLVANGYHDAVQDHIPVIVMAESPGAADDAAITSVLPAFSGTTAFSSIPGVAGYFEKSPALATLGETLASNGAATGTGIVKIWLDRKVTVSLEDSVPHMGVPEAWDADFDGTGITVAILDTGIDPDHPDLEGKVVLAKNFAKGGGVAGSGVADEDAKDRHGHGTHVAGIVAGTGAASGGLRKGVAPGADLINGKVLGDGGTGDTSWIISGMEWAAANADIVNMSLGSSPTDGTDPVSVALNNLTEQHDVLFIVASGIEAPMHREPGLRRFGADGGEHRQVRQFESAVEPGAAPR